jgi:hypothetical protein
MKRREWLTIVAAAAIPLLAAGWWVKSPGYTDADYYMATAVRLATGHGLSEPFIWNFLAGVQQIPHPSHLYWMPLTTLLAALPMALAGIGYRVAQVPFLLVALCLPPMAAWIAVQLGGERADALLAGGLAALPGFYLPFLLTTDAFGLYAVLGTLCFASLARLVRTRNAGWGAAAGACIGLAQLTRADGLLLALPAMWVIVRYDGRRLRPAVLLMAGYAAIFLPWMVRLYAASGSPLPPGAGRALWLTDYDSLFSYPPDSVSAAAMLAGGTAPILAARWHALLANLGSLAMVNGLVFLGPLMLWGGWRRRGTTIVQSAAVYLVTLLVAMSIVFPFPGARGGFFHSSSALMPTAWALAAIGLRDAVRRLAAWRGWEPARAAKMFSFGAVAISLVATGFLVWVRLIQPGIGGGGWAAADQGYRRLGVVLEDLGAAQDSRLAVNNPPGCWLATGRQAVVIPDGGTQTLLAVVRDFDVDWVALDPNYPAGLEDLYREPRSVDGLAFVKSVDIAGLGVVRLFQTGGGG